MAVGEAGKSGQSRAATLFACEAGTLWREHSLVRERFRRLIPRLRDSATGFSQREKLYQNSRLNISTL